VVHLPVGGDKGGPQRRFTVGDTEVQRALRSGIRALDQYFGRFDLAVDESIVTQLIEGWDRFGVMGRG